MTVLGTCSTCGTESKVSGRDRECDACRAGNTPQSHRKLKKKNRPANRPLCDHGKTTGDTCLECNRGRQVS